MEGGSEKAFFSFYGEKGVPSSANIPGARGGSSAWYDSITDELWLFGGHGYAETDEQGSFF